MAESRRSPRPYSARIGSLAVALALMMAPTLTGAQGSGAVRAPGAPPAKELIAVLDLEPVGAEKVQASAATDRLREDLLKSGRFTLVDRAQMDQILKEQAFQQTGCTSQECAVQVGKVLGVRKLVTGRVTRLDDRNWLVSAQLVDVESAATERAESLQHDGTFPTLLGTGIGKLAGQLAALTPAVPLASQPPAVPAPPQQEVQASGGISKWWWVAGGALLLGVAAAGSGSGKSSKKSGGGSSDGSTSGVKITW